MTIPNMDISNLIAATGNGNPQELLMTAQEGDTNQGFTSVLEGIGSLMESKLSTSKAIVGMADAEAGVAIPAIPDTEVSTQEALESLTNLMLPQGENGNPLPVSGEQLPVEFLKPALSDGGNIKPVTIDATPEALAAIPLPVQIVSETGLQISNVGSSETDSESMMPMLVAKPQVRLPGIATPSEFLAATITPAAAPSKIASQPMLSAMDTRPLVTGPDAQLTLTDLDAPTAAGTPALQQLSQLYRGVPVNPVVTTGRVDTAMANRSQRLKAETPLSGQQAIPVAGLSVESESEMTIPELLTQRIPEKQAETQLPIQPQTVAVSKPQIQIMERLPVVEAAHLIQQDNRINETLHNPLRMSMVQSQAAAETVVLPETLSLRQQGWGQNLGNNILWMIKEDLQSASIRVKPAELGPLNIQVSVQQDQLQINISALNSAAREALEAALPRMREQFSTQGFQQVNVDISQQEERGFAQQQNDSDHPGASESNGVAQDDQTDQQGFSAETHSSTVLRHDGLLDAFA